MKRKNTTRNALFTSIMSLLLCVSMLVGTTFAWFTDSVESGRNVIAAGNLDVELFHTNRVDKNEQVKGDTMLFDDVALWEPGAVLYETLQVKNVGTLALKYDLNLTVLNETVVGDAKLSDAIKVGVINGELGANTTRDGIVGAVSAWTPLSKFSMNQNGVKLEVGGDDIFTVVLYWQPNSNEIDNKFNMNNTNQGKKLELEIGVNLYATQVEAESDSFGIDYDAGAYIEDDAALEDALTQNKETIIVNLTSDVTWDVAAWEGNPMGGELTKTIAINGNGHTITFNKTNSDWTNIVTGDAVLIIENATITDSGYDATSGTWNGHDITFAGEVKLNNVVSLSALALMDNATLNNVTLTDDSTDDAYGLWIRPNGQTVTIDGLTMDMTGTAGDDRGIKIDNQHATDSDKGVTLTVKNSSFKTEKKGAILVKSTGTVNITLENVDISGVAADPINHVWIDGDNSAYAGNTTVTGGTKVIEGQDAPEVVTDGLYKVDNTYYVTNANGMSWLSAQALTGNNNTEETATYSLLNDIDMGGASFSAMIAQRGDKLIFNGNGHTISNVKVVSGDNDNTTGQASMFYAYPGSTLTVSDLTLENITVTADANASGYAAAVVGYCEGTAVLNNVDVVNATVIGVKSSGALAGHMSGSLTATNCEVSGTVTLADFAEEADGHYAGKYLGTMAGATALNNCTANVTVSGNLNDKNDGAVYGRKTDAGSLTINGAQQVDSAEALDDALANGATNVALTEDVTIKSLANATAENLTIDIAPNTTVTVATGAASGKDLTFTGDGTVVLEGAVGSGEGEYAYHDGSNLTFKGITFDATQNEGICARGGVVTFEDCVITGEFVKTTADKFVFKGCTFDVGVTQAGYGCSEVVFEDCKFETDGYGIKIYSDTTNYKLNLTVKNCSFKNTGSAAKSAIFLDHLFKGTINITVEDCTFEGYAATPTPNENIWATRMIDEDSFVKTEDGQYIFSYQTVADTTHAYHQILTMGEDLVVTVK